MVPMRHCNTIFEGISAIYRGSDASYHLMSTKLAVWYVPFEQLHLKLFICGLFSYITKQ